MWSNFVAASIDWDIPNKVLQIHTYLVSVV